MSTKTDHRKEAAIGVIRKAAERWPSSFIPRREVPNFTGGLISTGTLANLDCAGTGVPGAFRIGRQICYPVDAVCEWLISRMDG